MPMEGVLKGLVRQLEQFRVQQQASEMPPKGKSGSGKAGKACQLSLALAYFVWPKIIIPLWPREAERLDTVVVKCLAEFPFEVWRYDGNIHSRCVLDLSVNIEVQFK
ncbi:PIN4 isoform 1 [Pongo abelii]|uniref:PIN4 isoform 1 n=1 Tax=Pongo abelii TaxID=9601 RepID=A0A2J8R829_PONAB|nr:PIN4 isoform 1 [Pongo abelii]